MSDSDSLYRVSVEPPSRSKGISNMSPKVGKRTGGWTLSEELSKRRKDDSNFQKHIDAAIPSPFAVPTAKMKATPPKKLVVSLPGVHNNLNDTNNINDNSEVEKPYNTTLGSNLTRSKEAEDYQAEADRVEALRDQDDPDFRGTQDSDEILVASAPRKRRQSENHPLRSPPALRSEVAPAPQEATTPVQGMKARTRNTLYEDCSDPTKTKRDNHIHRISENWAVPPKVWIPESLLPKHISRKTKRHTILRNPQDWTTGLLEELAYFSHVSKGEQAKACEALVQSVIERHGTITGTELMPGDVSSAFEQFNMASAPLPATPISKRRKLVEPITRPSPVSKPQTEMDIDGPVKQLPSPPTPTVGRNPLVRQDSRCDLPSWAVINEQNSDTLNEELAKLEELNLLEQEKEAKYALIQAERERLQQQRRVNEAMRLRGE